MKSRTAVMRFFAPCLAVSFVLLWLPWPGTGRHIEGLHMITALFLYDAFFRFLPLLFIQLLVSVQLALRGVPTSRS